MTGGWNVVYLSTVLLFTTIIFLIFKALRNPLRHIPGPWHSLVTSYPLKLDVLKGRRLHHIHRLHLKYGPIVRVGPTELAVADIDAYKIIYRAGLAGFQKDDWYFGLTDFPIKAVFNMSDNKEHATRRRMLAPGFTKTNIVREWQPVVQENTKLAMRQMHVSATALFGESFEMLMAGERNQYIRDLEKVMMWGGLGYEFPMLRFISQHLPPLPFEVTLQLSSAAKTISQYGQKAVAASRLTNTLTRNVFKTMIADAEKGLPSLTDLDVSVEAGNLQIAGTDTTANTLTFLVWAVAKRPEIQLRLAQEVAVVREEELNDVRLSQLPFLDAVIQETLRLYPAVGSSLLRVVPRGGADLCGYAIPEGTTVGTTAYTIHRLSSVWGPDAEKFRPERWLEYAEKGISGVSDEAKAAFNPFGGGSRSCLGLHLAMMELRIAVAMFYREFKVSMKVAEETTDESMEMEDYFVIAPKGHTCVLVAT
ncbi:cytochrome P450 [Rhizodiscina lignyota]|uniref:Cytochrome P450 n=1 Tax=Rhizodiscina lignyota TaxID=1504668 RepID=A0A9P4IRA9_9PEZI|nr:cytochrome P450 [Rhizodiscina lignyota]